MKWKFLNLPELHVAGCHMECETGFDVHLISKLIDSGEDIFTHVEHAHGNNYFFHCPISSSMDNAEFEKWKKKFHRLYTNSRANLKYWRSKDA